MLAFSSFLPLRNLSISAGGNPHSSTGKAAGAGEVFASLSTPKCGEFSCFGVGNHVTDVEQAGIAFCHAAAKAAGMLVPHVNVMSLLSWSVSGNGTPRRLRVERLGRALEAVVCYSRLRFFDTDLMLFRRFGIWMH